MKTAYADETTWPANWAAEGLCVEHPDAWFPRSWAGQYEAMHACRRHCPVLQWCARALESTPADRLQGAVMAGIAHHNNGRPQAMVPPKAMRCWRCPGGGP